MTTRETTKLALDALVALVEYHTGVDQVSTINDGRQAIAALTAELAKPEPEPVGWFKYDRVSQCWHPQYDSAAAKYTALQDWRQLYTRPSESAAVALLKKMRDNYATFPAGLKDKIDAVLAGQEQASVPEGWQPPDDMIDAYCGAWRRSFEAANPFHTVSLDKEDMVHIEAGLNAALAAALDTAQPVQVNAMLVEALEGVKSRRKSGYVGTDGQYLKVVEAALTAAKQAQPPAPSDTAITYMTGYSDGREWAQADMLRTIKELHASLAWITEYIRAEVFRKAGKEQPPKEQTP